MAGNASDDIYSFLGRRIREERKARGLTLEELASRAGMNTSFLHYIEKNKKRASLNMANRIANALGVPLADLFRGAPAQKPEDIPVLRRITELVREAPPGRRTAILKVVKALSRPG